MSTRASRDHVVGPSSSKDAPRFVGLTICAHREGVERAGARRFKGLKPFQELQGFAGQQLEAVGA